MNAVQSSYRSTLQNALGAYVDALKPIPTPLPNDRDEVQMVSQGGLDRPGLASGQILERTRYTAHVDLGVQPGRGHAVSIPSYGKVHCDVRPNTRAQMAIDLYNGPPNTVIEFNPPLWIPDPLQFVGSQVVHALCGLSLEAVDLREDGSIWIRGRIQGAFGLINRPLTKCVRSVPEDAPSNDPHPLTSLVLGAGKAVLLAVPRVMGAVINSFNLPRQHRDAFVELWESVYPLLEPGTVAGHGAFEVDKPMALRTDAGDFVFEPQELTQNFEAEVIPIPNGVELRIAKGSELNSKTLAMKVSGNITYDGHDFVGHDIAIDVQHVQFDALMNNGRIGETLVPMHVNSRYDGKGRQVANLKAKFTYTDKLDVHGEVQFRLPAQIRDANRDLHTAQGDLHIDRADLGLVLKGHAKIGKAQQPAGTALSASVGGQTPEHVPNHGDADVRVRVDQLNVDGHLRTHLGMLQTDTPLHLLTDGHERPLVLRAFYTASCLNQPGEFGGTLRFLLPAQVDPPGNVRLDLPRDVRLHARQAALGTDGRVVFGNQVSDKDHDMEGHVKLTVSHLGGTLETHGADLSTVQVDRSARLQLQTPCILQVDADLAHTKNAAKWPVSGTGHFTLAAQTPVSNSLHLQVPGGPLHLLRARATATCNQFHFAIDGDKTEFDGAISVDHSITGMGHYAGDVSYKDGETNVVPSPLPTWGAVKPAIQQIQEDRKEAGQQSPASPGNGDRAEINKTPSH